MINFLPPHALEAIDRHDWTAHRKDRKPNITRFYKYLMPFGNDMEIHTVAVKTRKDGTVCVKEVVIASVDDPWMHVKDVACMVMSGYVVDWSPEKIGRAHYWSYNGNWESEAYGRRCKWKIGCQVINPEALQRHLRFQYCSWTPDCGHILDYLKAYIHHPRIELLSKIGAGRFASKVGFVRQLEKSKEFTRFFMDHLPVIEKEQYGVDAIRMSFKKGIPLTEASYRIDRRREFRGFGLPAAVDAIRATEFIRRQKHGLCSKYEYCNYLKNCAKIGLDLTDTKVIFPKQFKRRASIVHDQMAEVRRQADVEHAKRVDREIAAVAAKFARLEKGRSAFRITLPRKAADLIREGERMRNCLGSYSHRIARGDSIVAFVRRARRPGATFVAVEYSPSKNEILQCYAAKNQKPPKPVIDFCNRMFMKRKLVAA